MNKVIIFGAGELGQEIFMKIKGESKKREKGALSQIICFIDNFSKKIEEGEQLGVPIFPFYKIKELEFDEVIIASQTGYDDMIAQLEEAGVEKYKINKSYCEGKAKPKREILKDFSKIVYEQNLEGNVAEAGVFQGEYAKYINKFFPDRKLYLFDTFEGLDRKDLNNDIDIFQKNNQSYSLFDACDYLKMTSIENVLSKMEDSEKCIVKKGYFPDTAVGVEDKFVFVSLDMDLYKPTLEGLRFFWPRLVLGGCIIMDDYFSYSGIKKAVQDFIAENPNEIIRILPVGDNDNILLCK